jgi:hypothetical protein
MANVRARNAHRRRARGGGYRYGSSRVGLRSGDGHGRSGVDSVIGDAVGSLRVIATAWGRCCAGAVCHGAGVECRPRNTVKGNLKRTIGRP